MTHFTWHDDYQIGNETIDQHHKYLFDLANKICDPHNIKDIKVNLMLLFKYVREHHSDEESLMRDSDYPRYRIHVHEHEKLLNNLHKVSSDIGNGITNFKNIVECMQHWLLEHILKEDMLIGEHLSIAFQEENDLYPLA